MANNTTKTVNVQLSDGWVELGNAERRDNLVDIFHEGDTAVRLYMGAEVPAGDINSVASIPIAAGDNYYVDCKNMTNKICVATAAATAQKLSFVEG